jgi:hypothetical protein
VQHIAYEDFQQVVILFERIHPRFRAGERYVELRT